MRWPPASWGRRTAKENEPMARFQLTQALVVGQVRLKAGRTIADSAGAAQPGDFIWTGLNSNTVHGGMTPLDASASTMKAASKYASEPPASSISGAASIDA